MFKKNWYETETSDAVVLAMQDYVDDRDNFKLIGLGYDNPIMRQVYEQCVRQVSRNPNGGTVAAVRTKAKNASLGISQKGLTGTTKQKRWASEIRGGMIAQIGDDRLFEALVRNAKPAKFWIENRYSGPRDLAARYIELVTANNEAAAAVNALTPGVLTREESALFDVYYEKRAALRTYLRQG